MPKLPLLALAALAAALAAVGCDDSPGRPTAANDVLWRLAPEGARGGIVISPYAVAMLEDGTIAARDFIAKAGPELAPLQHQLDQWLAPLGGGDAKLADLGLTRGKGAALFFGEAGKLAVVVLPIGDRDAFVTRAHGTRATTPDGADRIGEAACKMVGRHYACARSEDLLGTLGKGTLAPTLTKVRARGDLELIAELPLDGDTRSTLAAVAQLERGAVTVRGVVLQPPPAWVASLGEAQRPKTTIGRSAGFGVIDLRPLVADLPPLPLVEGVTVVDVAKTLAGPMNISVPAGELTLELAQPLADPAPVQKVLAKCDEVAVLAQFGARLEAGRCKITLPDAAIELDLWVDGSTLRAGKRDAQAAGAAVPLPPAALAMATRPWSFAMWGRGSMFSPTGRPGMPGIEQIDPARLMPVRVQSVINEVGFAVTKDGDALRFLLTARTVFANPPALVAKLGGLTARDALAGTAADKAQPIVDAHRTSPFARDHAAGQGGLLIAVYLIGEGMRRIAPIVTGPEPPPEAAPAVEQPAEGFLTRRRVSQYATIVYAEWLGANPDKPCPTMQELAAFVAPGAATLDEWGRPMVTLCGKDLPAGAKGLAVVSPGADGELNTSDDVRSYEVAQP